MSKLSTTEYLRLNGHDITTGIVLTIHDLTFVKDSACDEIKTNWGKGSEEVLNLTDIIDRLKDLYFLVKTNDISTTNKSHIDYINGLDRTFKRLESDSSIRFDIDNL